MSTAKKLALLLISLLLLSGPAQARDWFVRANAGGENGDGSKAKPFADPFQAIEKAEAGDAIHIAQGKYLGKLDNGEWEIPYDNISLIGGYNDDFSQRDPWKFKTQLLWDKSAKNRPKEERIHSTHKGIILDGLILDGQDQNEYTDDKKIGGGGRSQKSLDTGSAMVRFALPCTVKNCIIINPGHEAIVCPVGSTIENNLILNSFETGVKVNSLAAADPTSKIPAVIKNNTILWSWCEKAPAKGRYSGAAISIGGPATISNNILGHCDNNAIYCTVNPDRTSITNNVFFMNLFSNFKLYLDGKDVVVDDKSMDLLEETGLKAFEGNTTVNPQMPLDPDWLDGAAKRTSYQRGKVEMDDWNKYRQLAGLPLEATGGKPASGLAPAYPLEKAVALMTPKKNDVKAGARIIKLEPKISAGGTAETPAKTYEKSDLATWAKNPESVDGKALEMTVAVASTANVNGIPSQYKPDDYEGVFLHDPTGEQRVTGFYKKGTNANRTISEIPYKYDGNGKPKELFTVKGTAYVVKNFPKAGFHIDSIVPLEAAGLAHARVKGRDWFIRAGSSGGDGSREKPFRDPYQALEKCEAGDFIHVAGGQYVGRLKTGAWKVDCPDITMLGGYNSDFSQRDPWKNPTLLYCPADYKGRRGGYTLQGEDDHTGFILDGFVFDKKLNNNYDSHGDMTDDSDHSPHIWLSKPGCVVRNCVFINGCEGAARLSSAQTIENNIFLNHGHWVVKIERTFNPETPAVVRNNTFAFAWEQRFGQGGGLTGELLTIENDVHATVDNNIFEFADQQAIRLVASPKDVELTNNVFAHNLWADIDQARENQIIDPKTFDKLAQLGWKKCEGNTMAIPGLPLDQKWFDIYLNRTAMVPGKVEMDDWNKAREILGQPVIATGGKAGTGYAPAYDYNLAMQLFPKNDKIKAGARPQQLEVKFEGITKPAAEQKEYTEVLWDTVNKPDEWAKLDGKPISMKIAIKEPDGSGGGGQTLPETPADKFSAWQVKGPEGGDSPGLPMRVFAPLGTRLDRAFKNSKKFGNGPVPETYTVKGIAKPNRQLLAESLERSE